MTANGANQLQRTILRDASIEGTGLFLGEPSNVTFHPAPANHGIVLRRVDPRDNRRPPRIAASIWNVTKRSRRTALGTRRANIETCEHVLSAIIGLGIDNVRVDVDGPEMPMTDGSSLPFAEALRSAGIIEQATLRSNFVLPVRVEVGVEPVTMTAHPVGHHRLEVKYVLNYGEGSPIPPQNYTYSLDAETYWREVAPARTFVLEDEFDALRAQGLCRHLTPRELLVIGLRGPLDGNDYRFPDEPARHKVLDVIGDLGLLGRRLSASVTGYRSGHALNHRLVHALHDASHATVQS